MPQSAYKDSTESFQWATFLLFSRRRVPGWQVDEVSFSYCDYKRSSISHSLYESKKNFYLKTRRTIFKCHVLYEIFHTYSTWSSLSILVVTMLTHSSYEILYLIRLCFSREDSTLYACGASTIRVAGFKSSTRLHVQQYFRTSHFTKNIFLI